CEYLSAPYLKRPGEAWRCADAPGLVHFILERVAPSAGFNAELLAQSGNSVDVTRRLLASDEGRAPRGDSLLDAEQAMIWGHAMHPTPKSREGVPIDDVLACSPEAGTRFPLYWFRVDPRLRRNYGIDVDDTLVRAAEGEELYPCHPWEVDLVLANPAFQAAREQGLIEPVGPRGLEVGPTSSVRTMYHAGLDYFLKLSIHVRLTNCVRKNAWYELESAVALTSLLRPVWNDVRRRVRGFDVLTEPAATTLDFGVVSGDAGAVGELTESFGMLYRDALDQATRERYEPRVAGALFATDRHGARPCEAMVRAHAASAGIRYDEAAVRWFESYAALLLDGVWLAFFEHGVVLEPHLQNTLLGFEGGLPARVWVRDLEGTKLSDSVWTGPRLADMSERARQSLLYPRDLGWKRIAYCALINNLGEAIFHLAAGIGGGESFDRLERRLWDVIGDIALRWSARFGAEELLDALVDGADLPSKNNLRTRLFRRADRESDYTALPSPLAGRIAAKVAA
ncbi:MAG: IucA/IucC family protein, partial [Luteibacter sp.]